MSDTFDFAAVGGTRIVRGGGPPVWDFGWVDSPHDVAEVCGGLAFPVAGDTPAGRVAEGELPDRVFLWDAHRKLFGQLPPSKNQGRVGSCVSFGTNTAVRRTMAVEIATGGELEEYRDIAEEVTYGGSRVEVGGGRVRGDGSVGAWAAKFVSEWGVVARDKYPGVDLTTYSENLCRQYGDKGVPTEMEGVARRHPVKTVTPVRTWDEAKRMLASGYGIQVASDQGFTMQRDANGVCRPSGAWAHSMCLDGYCTINGKEYGHIENSWGDNAHAGPVGPGDPGPGGFWAEAAVVDRMLRQGDAFAFSALSGFPARRIDWGKVL